MSVALEDMSAYARSVVERLGLEAHPEGGWYTRDWQSPHEDATSKRPLASLIYFLLPEGDASAWHKVDADELWLWHGPAPVTLELGGNGDSPQEDAGKRTQITLGSGIVTDDASAGDAAGSPITGHAVVPAGIWQRTLPGTADALVSCVVSPGFVFEGFTLE
ncbi:cupin domain-containing protein [Bifidobacterium scaligerum]|uniref:Cupin n=1 Tax=Bifidobacterium scaligerum TaxID=2052656 RepID=A0A2M9HRK9_9BIFI|nr:cupin domain-containing protein [Bifidobacterium scaligerum]PJM79427.1 cupin [Bifidobacterium scaligerum]